MDEVQILAARPLVARFVAAVRNGDADDVEAVCSEVAHRFGVCGPQALAVLTAGVLIEQQAIAARASREATRYAEAYMEQKNKVTELRGLLDTAASRMPAGNSRLRAV
ncbi:hypothetical protein G7068_11900 [Leucobacter viscericola]|uniref:Uncharacterized protein n=1 Tax=Leucobacter viscericola TaxID=2714935 RepID=A0A6G7XH29_9MICO|nr:hypothetical protein [Leucobacter viscericola]QIK63812.1 hypothetical protein G7068_11900 [Leucobacter viscericola]